MKSEPAAPTGTAEGAHSPQVSSIDDQSSVSDAPEMSWSATPVSWPRMPARCRLASERHSIEVTSIELVGTVATSPLLTSTIDSCPATRPRSLQNAWMNAMRAPSGEPRGTPIWSRGAWSSAAFPDLASISESFDAYQLPSPWSSLVTAAILSTPHQLASQTLTGADVSATGSFAKSHSQIRRHR